MGFLYGGHYFHGLHVRSWLTQKNLLLHTTTSSSFLQKNEHFDL